MGCLNVIDWLEAASNDLICNILSLPAEWRTDNVWRWSQGSEVGRCVVGKTLHDPDSQALLHRKERSCMSSWSILKAKPADVHFGWKARSDECNYVVKSKSKTTPRWSCHGLRGRSWGAGLEQCQWQIALVFNQAFENHLEILSWELTLRNALTCLDQPMSLYLGEDIP